MTYNQKRNSILAIVIFLAGLLAGGRLLVKKIVIMNSEGASLHQVVEVIDGDTIKIEGNIRVRLLGIDSPEVGECYYQPAKRALEDLIAKQRIELEKDITDKDHYGRLLRYVALPVENGDSILVNDYLVRNGNALAISSPPNNRYRDLFSSAQVIAKRNNFGLWGACENNYSNERREADAGPPNPDCIIKGNISEKGYGMTYLMPGCDNYETVKIDTRKGEKYFCTEKEAIEAGFRKATNCP